MSDSSIIRINPGQASVSLDLRNSTALEDCVKVDSNEDGRLIFVAKRPVSTFSTGEALLWRLLGWLNGQASLPSRDELTARLDADNLAAVDSILVAEGVA